MGVLLLSGCSRRGENDGKGKKYDTLEKSLAEYVADKDANIGVAVIINGADTVAVNGEKRFPMLSVYKFPIALAMAEKYRRDSLSLDNAVRIYPGDLHADTYSPMTERILSDGEIPDSLEYPARELLAYMLQQSDNNASDVVLSRLGGAEEVEKYLTGIGIEGISVVSSEDEMHADNTLCYANSATPLAMATLADRFHRGFIESISTEIKHMMETCTTGTGRLAKPLSGAVIGHKTGTGFTLENGRLMAVNDAGYVKLPDGSSYSIAVFIENSGYGMEETEALIAEISRMVHMAVRSANPIEHKNHE